ncbi:MAG: hypothetical protein FWG56_12070 [Desulfovibrionaceae bacterium]|nr:hypothetical protein [Desulfovibrionaceae bacterium]
MATKPRAHKINRDLPIALRLTDAEREQVKKLATKDGRSYSGFARQMYLRGLSAYLSESRTPS